MVLQKLLLCYTTLLKHLKKCWYLFQRILILLCNHFFIHNINIIFVGVRYHSECSESDLNTQEIGALSSVNQLGTNTYSINSNYFSNEGAVAFQYDALI